MGHDSNCGRRDFLKKTALGTAGLTAGLSLLKPEKAEAATWPTGGWPAPTATPNTMAINPNIDNLRVVCMYDPTMVTNQNLYDGTINGVAGTLTNKSTAFAQENAAINTAQVMANLDTMAMFLAQKTTAAEAWSTIFQKPSTKTWAQVQVAIKINTCNWGHMPHPAVIGKICQVLFGMGVPAANINIYDNNCTNLPYYSTPDATVTYFSAAGKATGVPYPGVLGNFGGVTTSTTVPNIGTAKCIPNLVNGTVDILVNIAVNKGHSLGTVGSASGCGNTGGVTLCLKNHFGTFPASAAHGVAVGKTGTSTAANAISYNQSSAIVGGTPVRQQLCIVDSLWADTANNPDAVPTAVLNRLIMGTFAGAVDYLTTTMLRVPVLVTQMGQPNNMDMPTVDTFLTSFGYTTTDPNLTWVPLTASSVFTGVRSEAAANQHARTLEIRVAGGMAATRFELPQSTSGAMEIRMFDLSGRSVRKMLVELQSGHTAVSWDAKNDGGRPVAPGTYEVRVMAGHFMQTGRIMVE